MEEKYWNKKRCPICYKERINLKRHIRLEHGIQELVRLINSGVLN